MMNSSEDHMKKTLAMCMATIDGIYEEYKDSCMLTEEASHTLHNVFEIMEIISKMSAEKK